MNAVLLDEDGIPLYVPGEHTAYTEGYHIYFNTKGNTTTLDQHSVSGIALIAHELVHTRQYQRSIGFPVAYLAEAGRVRANGGDPGGYGNKFEKEAYDEGGRIEAELRAKYKDGVACP